MRVRARHPLVILAAAGVALAFGSAAAREDTSKSEEEAMRAAVDRAAAWVVGIETVGGLERVGEVLAGTGPTSGVVVSADGLIISSAFNFAQHPTSIVVTLDDGN